MKVKLLGVVVLLLSLVSCENKSIKDEENLVLFSLQNSNAKKINREEYYHLFELEKVSIVYVYSSSCLACRNVYNNYLKNYKCEIYFLNKDNLQNDENIMKYHQKSAYISYFKGYMSIKTPLFEVISNYQVIDYMVGENKNIYQFLDRYL